MDETQNLERKTLNSELGTRNTERGTRNTERGTGSVLPRRSPDNQIRLNNLVRILTMGFTIYFIK